MDRFLGLVKIFIVVAGICLVLGTGTLLWKLFNRGPSTTPAPASVVEATPPMAAAAPEAVSQPAAPAQTEVQATMPVPKGAVVIDMRMQGNRALLLLRTPQGDDYLSLIDPGTGRRYSLVRLQQEDAAPDQLGTAQPER